MGKTIKELNINISNKNHFYITDVGVTGYESNALNPVFSLIDAYIERAAQRIRFGDLK